MTGIIKNAERAKSLKYKNEEYEDIVLSVKNVINSIKLSN
jgi:hypothetical protein